MRQLQSIQKSGDTALHISASAGGLNDAARYECLEILMSLGASLDLPNKASKRCDMPAKQQRVSFTRWNGLSSMLKT